jgi:hypothetical protein
LENVLWVDNDGEEGLGENYLLIKSLTKKSQGNLLIVDSLSKARLVLRKEAFSRVILDLHFGPRELAYAGLELYKEVRGGDFQPTNSKILQITIFSNYANEAKNYENLSSDKYLDIVSKLGREAGHGETVTGDKITLALWQGYIT